MLQALEGTVTKLNNGRNEFNARAEAQMQSWQKTIERYHKVAAGAAEQNERLDAAVECMQNQLAEARAHFADVGKNSSNSWAAYRKALRGLRKAFEEAQEAAREEFQTA